MNERGMIKITAGLPGQDQPIFFYTLCDSRKVAGVLPEKMKKLLEGMLKDVKLEKTLHIYGAETSYDLCEPDLLRLSKKNTLVEVTIPFCLYLPQDYECDITIAEENYSAYVKFKKIWTDKSTGSSSADLFVEDKVTYYSKSEITTPNLPQPEEHGWELLFTGKNVTKTRDNSGYFRYSKLYIEIDTTYDKEKLVKNEKYFKNARKEISVRVIKIVNQILDVYRYVTNETHIERLSSLFIRDIYFKEHNLGFIGIMMGYGIESAAINRSKREISQIEKMLKAGNRCPLHELLFLNAEASYHKNMFTLALVESFQALEIFLENFLISKYSDKFLTEKEIQKKLNHSWRTKDRLKDLLPEIGVASPFENTSLWNGWCTMYDKDRNNVIHKGKDIDPNKTRKALNLNKEMVCWIKNNSK